MEQRSLPVPDGLAGEAIPLHVAIASVADAVDAMTYDRVYRHGLGPDATIAEVIAGSGGQFNPCVVEVLLDLYRSGNLPLEPRSSISQAA